MTILSRISVRIFTVVLLVTFAVLSVPASGVSADEIEFKCWAVFIGLSEYQQIDPSEGCAEAATGFYETISRIWGEEYCKLLTNDEATKNKIHKAINWLADNAGADDIVLIYYAGHGDPSGYLSTYNSYYTDTWIGTVEMNSWLHYIKSQKMIIVLDSCHSGRFVPSLQHEGRIILTSSKSNELSYIFPDSGGIFTVHMLDAIHDFIDVKRVMDFNLSAEEIFALAEPQTISDTTNYAETIQHPLISDGYEDELSLLIHFVLATDPPVPLVIDVYASDGESHPRTDLLTWAPGSVHDVEALTPINAGEGTKYVFNSWADGSTEPLRVISGEGKYTANYDRQYRLEISSEYGNPAGQGWYVEGVEATIFIESIDGPAERHYFNGWSGDYSGDETTAQITMDAPKNIIAEWRSEYLLSIESDRGKATGSGWYEDGDIAEVAIESIEGPDTRHHFTGWSGDFTGNENSFEITIDSPKSITANWESEYFLNIESDRGEPAGAGWYNEGDIAVVMVESIETTDARHHFIGWSGDYTGDENSFEIKMDTPKTLITNWRSEYLVTVESDYGEPVGGGWYDENTRAAISVPDSHGFLIRQVFDGWSGDFDGMAATDEITITKAMSITAEWRTDYIQLYMLLGVLVIIAVAIYFIFRKRWQDTLE
jgi:hypothetical protein